MYVIRDVSNHDQSRPSFDTPRRDGAYSAPQDRPGAHTASVIPFQQSQEMEMARFTKKRTKKAGLPPGTLVHTGEVSKERGRIVVFDYGVDHVTEKELATAEECRAYRQGATASWINVYGLGQVELLEQLGQIFELHPLVLEDILNTDQRPKMEDYGDYIYIVLKTLAYSEARKEVVSEQVSVILGDRYLISFHESAQGDFFGPVRDRLRNAKGRIRKVGVDYLAYALADTVVDHFFVMLEQLGGYVDSLEEELVLNPQPKTMRDIHKLKRDMIYIRKSVWPVREVVTGLERAESPLIQASTLVYLRDVYDHTIHAIDTVETLRDMLSGMVDIYLSSITNKLNEVMKVLTVITTVFIPPGLVAGIYGMNFHRMPELEWEWGYGFALVLMAALSGAMYLWFRRRRWL
jgi:magnesium transporter